MKYLHYVNQDKYKTYFPDAKGSIYGIDITGGKGTGPGSFVGLVLASSINKDVVEMHLHLYQAYRTPKFIKGVLEHFKQALDEYTKIEHKKKVISACEDSDETVKHLFKLLGFRTRIMHLAEMDFS